MARLRRKPAPEAVSEPENTASDQGAPEVVAGPTIVERKPQVRRPRVILHFDPDGKPELGNLEPETRARLQAAFAGGGPAAGPEPAAPVDPALVGMVLKGLGSLEAAMLAGRFGLDAETCRRVVGPPEPLAGMMAETGARVISKYNLTGKYGDEIALACLIMTWQAGALQQLRALGREKADEKRRGMGPAAAGEVNSGAGAGAGE